MLYAPQATKTMAGVMTAFLQQKKNFDTGQQQLAQLPRPTHGPRGLQSGPSLDRAFSSSVSADSVSGQRSISAHDTEVSDRASSGRDASTSSGHQASLLRSLVPARNDTTAQSRPSASARPPQSQPDSPAPQASRVVLPHAPAMPAYSRGRALTAAALQEARKQSDVLPQAALHPRDRSAHPLALAASHGSRGRRGYSMPFSPAPVPDPELESLLVLNSSQQALLDTPPGEWRHSQFSSQQQPVAASSQGGADDGGNQGLRMPPRRRVLTFDFQEDSSEAEDEARCSIA